MAAERADRVFTFFEGPTEEIILKILTKSNEWNELDLINVRGKSNFRSEIIGKVKALFDPGEPGKYVSILIFRDVDNGEQDVDLRRNFLDIASFLLEKSISFESWNVLSDFPNISILDFPPTEESPGLKMIFHLATTPPVEDTEYHLPSFSDKTTDGYLIHLALTDKVLERFAKDAKVEPNAIMDLVTNAIPNLFNETDDSGGRFRPQLDKDKDFLAAYLLSTNFWKVKRTDRQETLSGIIFQRSRKYSENKLKNVFSSWFRAIEEARR